MEKLSAVSHNDSIHCVAAESHGKEGLGAGSQLHVGTLEYYGLPRDSNSRCLMSQQLQLYLENAVR